VIWKDQKAGQACRGCGDILLDDPNPSSVHWLLHTKTMMTICEKMVIKGPNQTVEESLLPAVTKSSVGENAPVKKRTRISAKKDATKA
jgi:hypothetical protein